MSNVDEKLLGVFAQALRNRYGGDARTFSVIIEDPERGLYGVRVKRYIDADRAGFSGYVSDMVLHGLSQVEASRAVEILEE